MAFHPTRYRRLLANSDNECIGHPKLKRFFARLDPLVRNTLAFDQESVYSTTTQDDADAITHTLTAFLPRSDVVVDATACLGGNTYSLQKIFPTVAIEIDRERAHRLKGNLQLLECAKGCGVTVVNGDSTEVLQREVDVYPGGPRWPVGAIVIGAPWGGESYYKEDNIEIYLEPTPEPPKQHDEAKSLRRVVSSCYGKAKVVVLLIPDNYNIPQLTRQLTEDHGDKAWAIESVLTSQYIILYVLFDGIESHGAGVAPSVPREHRGVYDVADPPLTGQSEPRQGWPEWVPGTARLKEFERQGNEV